MTADSFKQRLLELTLALREDAAAAHGSADATACERCGRAAFEPADLETEAVVEYYALVCPVDGCDGEVTFARLYVAAGTQPRLVRRDFAGAGCTTPGCDPADHLDTGLVDGENPFRRLEYHLPVAGLLETPVRERRVDVEGGPKTTLELCRACYGRIRDEDGRSEPEPESTESEPPAPEP